MGPLPPEREVVTKGVTMQASVGDHLVVRSHHSGQSDREGEILAVRGDDGGPPYVVRWSDTGHESVMFPGTDAEVRHVEHAAAAADGPVHVPRALKEELAHPGG